VPHTTRTGLRTCVAVFLLALVTLATEILLTRF
jgi:hypothetical protein